MTFTKMCVFVLVYLVLQFLFCLARVIRHPNGSKSGSEVDTFAGATGMGIGCLAFYFFVDMVK
jgi:multisubunit Na+/H+ antiporter MnhF subunit